MGYSFLGHPGQILNFSHLKSTSGHIQSYVETFSAVKITQNLKQNCMAFNTSLTWRKYEAFISVREKDSVFNMSVFIPAFQYSSTVYELN